MGKIYIESVLILKRKQKQCTKVSQTISIHNFIVNMNFSRRATCNALTELLGALFQ